MVYDPYSGIPNDLRPTLPDAVILTEIANIIKEAVKIRHDFHTAIHVSDTFASIKQAFVPTIVSRPEATAERHLGPAPAWKSSRAQGAWAGAKTMAGLAAEHLRLKVDAKARAGGVRGNARLAKLLREQIDAFFPDIGYSPASGNFLRRLRKDERSVLQAFHPLGVEDAANVIRLLLQRKPAMYYYW